MTDALQTTGWQPIETAPRDGRQVTDDGVFVGPPPRRRVVHRAAKINQNGGVSPLCAKTPRALDLRRASWVLRDEAVTCPKCLAIIHGRADGK